MSKEKRKKRKDLIIKIVLIIIIILLLVHNCCVLEDKKNVPKPSGNVNIIEIMCEDKTKCDNGSNGNNNLSGDTNNPKTSKSKGILNGNGSSNNSTNNNSTNNSSSSSSGNSSNDDTEEEDLVVEPEDELFVRDKRLVWDEESQLKIFTNSVYNFEEKIAPESYNTYLFIVKNSTDYNVNYNMTFSETNPYNINMKYKLKKNDTYIIDDYVSYDQLSISDQILNAKKNDTFYLEWKWFSSDNDTEAGKNQAKYHLKIEVKAESIND